MQSFLSLLQKMLPEFCQGADNFYVHPFLPTNQLKGARETFAPYSDGETPLLLVDNTMRGNGREGILLTDCKLYWTTTAFFSDGQELALDALPPVSFSRGWMNASTLLLEGSGFKIEMHLPPSNSMERFAGLLNAFRERRGEVGNDGELPPDNLGCWYLAQNGVPSGPHTEPEVAALLLSSGPGSVGAMVCRLGKAEWTPIAKEPTLRHVLQQIAPGPPPLPQSPTKPAPQPASPPDLPIWHLALDGRKTGPYTQQAAEAYLREQGAQASRIVAWRDGWKGWSPVGGIAALAAAVDGADAASAPPVLPAFNRPPSLEIEARQKSAPTTQTPAVKSVPANKVDSAAAQAIFSFVEDAKTEMISQINVLMKKLGSKGTSKVRADMVDPLELEGWITALRAELRKVEELHLTIACVGTMKAGKSTTINAIVGKEIVPNRQRPMTVLPTVITHERGRVEPVLRFSHSEPFDKAAAQIRTRLKELAAKGRNPFAKDKELNDSARTLLGEQFRSLGEERRGEKAIYAFMETLNDIVRLAEDEDIKVESPLISFSRVDQFPQISVEFSYFQDRFQDVPGKMSLIDTPGPNEAGRGHLRDIVNQQLEQASAIICVVDSTQIGSDADGEMRDAVRDIQRAASKDVYVFLNRIDLAMGRDMKPEELVDLACHELFPSFTLDNGRLATVEGRVFPIAAKLGFLANRAERALREKNELPSAISNDWVEEFGKQAYGIRGSVALATGTVESHREASAALWETSRLKQPLEEVIAFSLQNAAPLCLKAAADQTAKVLRRAEESLNIRIGTSGRRLDELTGMLEALQGRLRLIEEIRGETIGLKKRALDEVAATLRKRLQESEVEIASRIEKLARGEAEFQEEKLESQREKMQQSSKMSFPGLIASLFGGKDSPSDRRRALSGKAPIEFDSKEEGDRFVHEVLTDVQDLVVKQTSSLVEELEVPVDRAQKQLKDKLEMRLLPLVEATRGDFKDTFDLSIELPELTFRKLSLNLGEIGRALIDEEERTHTGRREQTGWGGSFKRGFGWLTGNDDWGYDEYDYTVTTFRVSPDKIRAATLEMLKKMMGEVNKDVKLYLDQNLGQQLESYFKKLSTRLDELKRDVDAGVQLKGRDRLEQESLLKEQKELKSDLGDINERNQGIQNQFGNFRAGAL